MTERESGFFCDFEAMLARLVPLDARERERLIVALLGPRSEQIPFTNSRLCLGQWQRVLLFGFNGDVAADWHAHASSADARPGPLTVPGTVKSLRCQAA